MKKKYLILAAFFVMVLILILFRERSVFSEFSTSDKVRKNVVAGQFYPSDPQKLKQDIDRYLTNAKKVDVDGDILGIVVPHAGYLYSAAIAASGYRQVSGQKIDLVVVLAPSHRDPFIGATIYPGDAYQTPLGNCYIDKICSEILVKSCDNIAFSNLGHQAEHAIEVQLPFVQTIFPKVKIIPIVVGQYNWDICEKIGFSLANELSGKKALIIASTDLYHGYSYQECKKENSEILDAIVQMDPRKLNNGLLSQDYQACGGGPLVILQIAAQKMGADKALLLDRTNSGDVTGVRDQYIVGYGSVAIYKQKSTPPDRVEYDPLDLDVQKELLKMARSSIAYYLQNKKVEKFEPKYNVLNEKRGVFVTINKNGYLRGCIGHHESDKAIYLLVPEMAVAAAFGDPRFPPLQPDELDAIKIKVSVYLTNVYKIDNLEEFEMGVHGIIMQKDGRAATYLPEVPIEAGWNSVDEEMRSLCQKAGLPSDAWKKGAQFWLYRTQVFDESVL